MCRTLTTLLSNGLILDPLYGLNNETIADIGDVGREYYTFWFCNTFKTPTMVYYITKTLIVFLNVVLLKKFVVVFCYHFLKHN